MGQVVIVYYNTSYIVIVVYSTLFILLLCFIKTLVSYFFITVNQNNYRDSYFVFKLLLLSCLTIALK